MIPRPLRDPRALIGAVLLAILAFAAIFAPFLVRIDPNDQDLLATLLPAAFQQGGDSAHLLGTDALGRDVLARLLYAGRTALTVAVISALGAMVLGSILAYAAGYFGGWTDWLIGRAVEIWMSFPPVILALILMTGLGTGLRNVILAIMLVDWTRFCRVLRSEVLVIVRRDHVAAARLTGFSHLQTIRREIIPATIPLLITLLSLEGGIAVIAEAILSFVGLGVRSDQIAWGQMIADSREAIYQAPWNILAPTLAIFMTVAACNLLGDGLRRTLDVRLKEGRA